MEIKDIIQHTEQEEESTPVYMPSSSEKKRAVLMYLFIGIVVYLSKQDVNKFEYYHLKQATGRRILFLLALVVSVVLLFIPVIKIIAALLLIIFIAAWCLWVKQARDWFYDYWSKTNFLSLFAWVGNWFLDLFEIDMKRSDLEIDMTNTAKKAKDKTEETEEKAGNATDDTADKVDDKTEEKAEDTAADVVEDVDATDTTAVDATPRDSQLNPIDEDLQKDLDTDDNNK